MRAAFLDQRVPRESTIEKNAFFALKGGPLKFFGVAFTTPSDEIRVGGTLGREKYQGVVLKALKLGLIFLNH